MKHILSAVLISITLFVVACGGQSTSNEPQRISYTIDDLATPSPDLQSLAPINAGGVTCSCGFSCSGSGRCECSGWDDACCHGCCVTARAVEGCPEKHLMIVYGQD